MSEGHKTAFSEIYNLTIHGLMYLQEKESGNASYAFNKIGSIAKQQFSQAPIMTKPKKSEVYFKAIQDLVSGHHLVIDLETLAVSQNARVIAIGAAIGQLSQPLEKTFYRSIDMNDKIQKNRVIDGSTVKWWFEQKDDVRQVVMKDAVNTISALSDFSHFVEFYARRQQIDVKNIYVWGNGVDFDNTILLSLYRDIQELGLDGFKAPFVFRRNMDIRTIYNTLKTSKETSEEIVWPTQSHNALEDAKAEFQTIANFFNGIIGE